MNELELFDKFSYLYLQNWESLILDRDKIKEFLQIKILEFIASQDYWDKLTLVWWTALRLFYNSNRWSEDLDFNSTSISKNEFENICEDIKNYLNACWHDVYIIKLGGNDYHSKIVITSKVFKDWKYIENISTVEIKIKMDVVNDNWDYPNTYLLPCKSINNIYIKTTFAEVLLDKKIIAFLSRDHNNSLAKDLYDIIFLLSFTKPNFDVLWEYEFISNDYQLYQRLMKRIDNKGEEITEKIWKLKGSFTKTIDIKSLEDFITKLKKMFLN